MHTVSMRLTVCWYLSSVDVVSPVLWRFVVFAAVFVQLARLDELLLLLSLSTTDQISERKASKQQTFGPRPHLFG